MDRPVAKRLDGAEVRVRWPLPAPEFRERSNGRAAQSPRSKPSRLTSYVDAIEAPLKAANLRQNVWRRTGYPCIPDLAHENTLGVRPTHLRKTPARLRAGERLTNKTRPALAQVMPIGRECGIGGEVGKKIVRQEVGRF